ncbi:hypothetical protein [Leptospira noguchii]|uniref:hypothetical protein n=1 Tax=Leptospira noguchii TaxID=28182 RepID=UPI0005690F9B|nr:hypothetical protein [Leptospira noguchii]
MNTWIPNAGTTDSIDALFIIKETDIQISIFDEFGKYPLSLKNIDINQLPKDWIIPDFVIGKSDSSFRVIENPLRIV